MKRLILTCITAFIILISCSKGSDNNPSTGGNNNNNGNTNTCTGTKSFSADVSPIIQTTCATSGCHNAGSANGPGALTSHQQIFNARTSIRSAVANGTMPKTGTLTATQKNALLCWIDNGAPNN